ncbi:signal peptide peptidase SppA [Bacillus sp. A301a_S52]|nr:signal peptide peptidase SppA [Bacillus sp. A301a_S52]
MNAKRWIGLAIAGVLLLASTLVSFFQASMEESWEDFFGGAGEPFHERVLETGTGSGKIAVIHVEGIIQSGASGGLLSGGYDHQMLLDQLDHAAEDPEVHGIVLRVNTPGGGVVESDEIHDKVAAIQEDYNKPVYASMGSQAASGGYYISAPAEQIYANPQTITGSLGVIMSSINISELAENWGIQEEVIKSGPYKDIMSSTRDMTDEERAILQDLVDDAYEQFVDVIEEGRDFERDEVYDLADGRIYTGSQALEQGLIDGLGHQDDVVQALEEALGYGNLTVVEYEANIGFSSLLGIKMNEVFSNQSQLTDIESWFRQNQGAQLMYLYTD